MGGPLVETTGGPMIANEQQQYKTIIKNNKCAKINK
jgi:hypothetical protein